ncbi:MAG: hypothetical protein WDW36_009265 [Sanguina aurantia]
MLCRPTLLDLVALHPRYLPDAGAATVKQLRLVSKGMSGVVGPAIHSCGVHLGGGGAGAGPTPQQLARLAHGARLRQLHVILNTASGVWSGGGGVGSDVTVQGPNAPSVAQQLASCDAQTDFLLARMGAAVNGVTDLILTVAHSQPPLAGTSSTAHTAGASSGQPAESLAMQRCKEQIKQLFRPTGVVAAAAAATAAAAFSLPSATCDTAQQAQRSLQSFHVTCPQALSAVSAAVFRKLAAAVPNLRSLSLSGPCWDASLQAFGASCPHLATFSAQIPHLPVQALQGLAQKLPHLRSVTFADHDAGALDAADLDAYVDACLLETQRCSGLASLHLHLANDNELSCKPASWALQPASLESLSCTCFVTGSAAFDTLTHRLSRLCLMSPPVASVVALLGEFPLLSELRVLGHAPMTIECDGGYIPGGGGGRGAFRGLKKRFLGGGFQLKCVILSLVGDCEEVQGVLAWLPPFPEVQEVMIQLTPGPWAHCLQLVPELFPAAQTLVLAGGLNRPDVPGVDTEFYEPLCGLPHLTKLQLYTRGLPLTMPGLRQLCLSLPGLEELTLRPCKGIDSYKLETRLESAGRDISVETHYAA